MVIMIITVVWAFSLNVGKNIHKVWLSPFIVLFQDIILCVLGCQTLSIMGF